MTKNQNIDAILSNVTNSLRNNPLANLQDIPSRIKKPSDLQNILDNLAKTSDLHLQIKLFLVLSACSFCNDDNLTIIIKCRALYEKINNILENGLPRNAVHGLNFLTSLLQVETEDTRTRRKLVRYAKDMVRISGCLGTMAKKFDTMMYIDTWNGLCQCLAAACIDCKPNQSYCAHLIPICIQKCGLTNKDIFLVLQNLLRNHNSNMLRFIDCNGLAIFTRELLQHDKCLQLLRTVVIQYPDAPRHLVRQTEVLNNLRDFVRIYGTESQIGHKAMIILHHIESRAIDPELEIVSNEQRQNVSQNMLRIQKDSFTNAQAPHDIVDLDNTVILMRNIANEVYNFTQNEPLENIISKTNISALGNISIPAKIVNKQTNTGQAASRINFTEQEQKEPPINIAKEPSLSFVNNQKCYQDSDRKIEDDQRPKIVYSITAKENEEKFANEPPFSSLENNNSTKPERKILRPRCKELSFSFLENKTNKQDKDARTQIKSAVTKELSFNFLENTNQQQSNYIVQRNISVNKEQSHSCTCKKQTQQPRTRINNKRELSFSFLENHNYKSINTVKTGTNNTEPDKLTAKKDLPNVSQSDSFQDIDKFNPIYTSTPNNNQNEITSHRSKHQSRNRLKRKYIEKKRPIINPEEDGNNTLRNTSLGSKFLNVINESCTSIFKTVTNIFKKKKTEDSLRESPSTKSIEDASCSFSFLKYMQKRDAMLNNTCDKRRDKDSSAFSKWSCDTCDDTKILKKKMLKDENLRKTVKKLKLGINLFGCDFKKISRTMWPRDAYMTPAVLYKLYRKLLSK